MISDYFLINKLEGETPLESLENLRTKEVIGSSVPMTYAGRLDPMAEGLLLILVGDECKKKQKYLGLDKEYEIEVLLGVGSDTGDILGIVKEGHSKESAGFESGLEIISEDLIKLKISELIGKRFEKYPAFSSKPINGKPMFALAKEGGLAEMDSNEIPQKEIEIYSIDFVDTKDIDRRGLVEVSTNRIKKVKGDFRQQEIMDSWSNIGDNLNKGEVGTKNVDITKFSIIKLTVKASSGAYMRTLAQKLGESLGTKALAWRIRRTKIGEYSL